MPRALKIFQDSSLLDDVQVASPCHASWADMAGSETVRFCGSCQKNVYNLSGMKRDEAVELLRASEGRLCVRFYRRADGTVLTEDCPVGVALVLRRAKRATLAAAALSLGAVAALLATLGGSFTAKTCQRINDLRDGIVEQPLMGAPPVMPVMTGEVSVPVANPIIEGEPSGSDAQEVKGRISRVPTMGKIKAPPAPQKTMGTMVLGRK